MDERGSEAEALPVGEAPDTVEALAALDLSNPRIRYFNRGTS